MPCDVTNDLGLRDCLLPDPQYPNIVSNGYVTTDEEDEDDTDEASHYDLGRSPNNCENDFSVQHGYYAPSRSQPHNPNGSSRIPSDSVVPDLSCKTDARINETNELNILDAEVQKLSLAVFEATEL